MSADTVVALDLGSLVTKAAMVRDGGPPQLTSQETGSGGPRGVLAGLLAGARAQLGGTPERVCCAVPDGWLQGEASGARRHEELRHILEDEVGVAAVSWVGQLVAVAGWAASLEDAPAAGRYLVCDVGGSGVRAALCQVAGREVQTLATGESAGGWEDLSRRLRAALPGDAAGGLDSWYRTAQQQGERAALVLAQAAADPAFRDARAYTLAGPPGPDRTDLTAGQLIDSFAPTADHIRRVIAAVIGAAQPDLAVLTGGLAWLPLAASAVAAAAGSPPKVLGLRAAAHGALLIARGLIQLAPARRPAVRLPVHQVSGGLIEEARLPLPWNWSFAPLEAEQVAFDEPAVVLEIAGELSTVQLPGLVPGRYRIGLRPARPGHGVLVIRSEAGPDRAAVHISPLDLERWS